MKPKRVRSIYIVFGTILLFLGIVFYQMLYAPNNFSTDRIITVSRAMMFSEVVDSLEFYGIIRSKVLFELAGNLLGATREMHIGKYLFRPGTSNKEILDNLRTGKSALLISVTLPEGIKATSQARIFRRELGIDSARFVQLVFDTAFVRSLGIESHTLEGYLFPETYFFSWQTNEEEIIRTLVEQFRLFYTDSLQEREQELGMTTKEIITLASIIEGETMVDGERPIIAGVYYNRLKRGMRLQADPTIQYVLPDGPRRLMYRDLEIESPYNTYRRSGLPPGPINNPGRAALLAALFPAQHQYLYFVADGSGGHVFSRHYIEHQRAVYRYRRILRQRI